MAQNMVVGGQFAVSPSGAATYTVPIQVPPGVAGMQPQLALVYNSQAGNGLLGMGWNISGLSAITRCPRTMAQDGVRGGVNYDANDRFCLDGQRLILVGGIYGAAGSEYRTEMESFARITYDGLTFNIQSKAGLTNQYGGTTDSRIEAQGRTVIRVWALNRTTDAVGNSMGFGYLKDSTSGSFRINQIDYTGNGNTGLSPLNSVRFDYETRPDPATLYQAGSLVRDTLRLSAIRTMTYAGLQPKRYQLRYAPINHPSERSRLLGISECDSGRSCLPELTFEWGTSPTTPLASVQVQAGNAFTPSSNWFSKNFQKRVWLADINGDGLLDLFGVDDFGLSWQLNNGEGFSQLQSQASSLLFADPWYGSMAAMQSRLWLSDLNGDGLPDVFWVSGSGLYWMMNYGSGRFGPIEGQYDTEFRPSFEELIADWFSTSIHKRVWLADINGDGLADLLGANDFGLYWQLNTGAGFAPAQWQYDSYFRPASGWFSTSTHKRVWLADINGDGLPDLLGANDSGLYWQLNTGTGFAPVQSQQDNAFKPAAGWFSTSINNRVWLVDVNGDGLPDLMGSSDAGLFWQLNTGKGFAPVQSQSDNAFKPAAGWFTTGLQDRVWLADVNGDGLPDLIGASETGLYWQLNTGTGFAAVQTQSDNAFKPSGAWFGTGTHGRVWLADVNGDGLPDFLGASDSGLYTMKSKGISLAGKIIGIKSLPGSGLFSNAITYGKSVSQGTNAQPFRLPGPLAVVSASTASNGVDSVGNSISYAYSGVQFAAGAGRGGLGFQSIKASDAVSGIESYTEYQQNWPYSGLPSLSETRLAGRGSAGVLKRVKTTYACKTGAGAACQALPANCNLAANTATCNAISSARVLPYASTVVEQSWDLGGAAMPVVTTNSTFEKSSSDPLYWGDASQIEVITSDGPSSTRKLVQNDYFPSATSNGKWIAGRLKKATVTSTYTPR